MKQHSGVMEVVVVLSVLMLAQPSYGTPKNIVDQFKAAASESHCKAIPFKGLQRLCHDAGKKKDKFCKSKKSSCSKLKAQVQNARKDLTELQASHADLRSRSPNHPNIPKVGKRIRKKQQSIKRYLQQIGKHTQNAWKCHSARLHQRRIFRMAERGVASKLAKDLQSYKQSILQHFNSEKTNHDKEIDNAKDNARDCEDTMADSLTGRRQQRYKDWLDKKRKKERDRERRQGQQQ